MATKPYPPHEEKPQTLGEPVVAYGNVMTSCPSSFRPTSYEMDLLRRSEEDLKAGRLYTQEEVDKMVEQWLN